MSGRWTFLSNHGRVFEYIVSHEATSTDIMAHEIGITQRVVFMILKDLENDGYITRKKIGRCNHYEIHADLPMWHQLNNELSGWQNPARL